MILVAALGITWILSGPCQSVCATTTTIPRDGWRIADGAEPERELVFTDAGAELRGTEGDMYGAARTYSSVFLRTPTLQPPYFVETAVDRVHPLDDFSQAGLIAWRDADNYVRLMTGFDPPAFECMAEFDGKADSVGTFPMYPDKLDHPIYLRLEVLDHTLRGYVSHDRKRWLAIGTYTLPRNVSSSEFIRGVGIAGVGGRMKRRPLFTAWSETPLPTASLGRNLLLNPANALLAQGNSGWGREQSDYLFADGTLTIRAFSGSDIFFGLEPYPFAGYEVPPGDWQLTAKVRRFDPAQEGAFVKAGLILRQNSRRFLNVGVVSDKQFNQMYFECVSSGEEERSRQWGWHGMEPSDLYFRISRKGSTYSIAASYDNQDWQTVPDVGIDLLEPQLRLMVSGDVFMQAPGSPPQAMFESVVFEQRPVAK